MSTTSPASYQQQLDQLRDALADPLDMRTPEEIGNDIGLTIHQVKQICKGKRFSKEVLDQFKEQIGISAPVVFKSLIRQAQAGSTSASKLYLEAAGYINGDGGIHFHQHSSASGGADYSKLSDDELDRDIARLLKEISVPDMTFSKGIPSPASYEIIESHDEV